MNRFKEKGISVTFLDNNMTFGVDTDNDAMQRLLFNVLGSFAEFERDMIVNRTGEGRQRAKEFGKKLGRKGLPEEDIQQALRLMEDRNQNGLSVLDIVKMTGVPKATVYKKIERTLKDDRRIAPIGIWLKY